MKKIYKNLLCMGLCVSIATSSIAQAISESFDDITTIAASGWAMNNLSSPVGTVTNWVQGAVGGVFDPQQGAGFIQGNFNLVAGANIISCWLISPSRTFSNGDVVTFYSRTVDAPAYADNLQVRLSLNGTSSNVGVTNTSVGDFTTVLLEINPALNLTSYPNTWTQYTITVSGLGAPTSGRLAFRYYVTDGGPTGNNSDNIGIDNFVYTPFASGNPDLTVVGSGEYTSIPLAQVTALPIEANVKNIGTASSTHAVLSANIYLAPDFTIPVQSFSSTPTTIAPSANPLINIGAYTPTIVGDYYIEYISSCTNNTITSADTSYFAFRVDDNFYARDNGTVTSAFGIGAGPTGYIGSMYTINTTTQMDSVLFALQKTGTTNTLGDAIGDSTKVVIYDVSGGLPTTIIGTSPGYIFSAADTSGLVVHTLPVKSIGGSPLTLAPGSYFVAVAEYNTNIGLAVCDDVFMTNTFFAGWTGQAFTPIETFGANFAKTPVIRPYFTSCSATSFAQTLSLCAGQNVTVGTATHNSTGVYIDILSNADGCDSTVTTNLTVGLAIASSQTISLCAGQNVTVGTATHNSTGVYTDILSAYNGCDSTVTTDLTVGNAIASSQTISLCAGESVTVGVAMHNSTGVYSDILTAANGCDSTVTTDLTVGIAIASSQTLSLCSGQSVTVGASSYNSTGVYSDVFTAYNGCDSTVTTDLSVSNPIDVTTNTNGPIISSNASGATYQWIDCDNANAIIAGETNQNFTTSANGNYAVIVTEGPCSDTSDCVNVNTTGINYAVSTKPVRVYPNPANGSFKVELNDNSVVLIFNSLGEVVFNEKMLEGSHRINIQEQPNGFYLLRVISENSSNSIKLIKE